MALLELNKSDTETVMENITVELYLGHRNSKTWARALHEPLNYLGLSSRSIE